MNARAAQWADSQHVLHGETPIPICQLYWYISLQPLWQDPVSWPLLLAELSSHFSTEQVLVQVSLPTIRQLYLHCIPVLSTAGNTQKNASYLDVCSGTSSNNSAPRVI